MAIDSLSSGISFSAQAQAKQAVNGLQPLSQNAGFALALGFVTGSGAQQANQVIATVRTLAAGANETLNLQALENLVGDVAVLARIKGLALWLLGTDETVGGNAGSVSGQVTGTACSSITAGNATNPWTGPLATGTMTISNGGFVAFGRDDATGWPVGASSRSLKIVNNDGAVAAVYALFLIGADI